MLSLTGNSLYESEILLHVLGDRCDVSRIRKELTQHGTCLLVSHVRLLCLHGRCHRIRDLFPSLRQFTALDLIHNLITQYNFLHFTKTPFNYLYDLLQEIQHFPVLFSQILSAISQKINAISEIRC